MTLVNWIIPGTAIGFLWTWIFNGQYGILNALIEACGGEGQTWLGQTQTAALICVVSIPCKTNRALRAGGAPSPAHERVRNDSAILRRSGLATAIPACCWSSRACDVFWPIILYPFVSAIVMSFTDAQLHASH